MVKAIVTVKANTLSDQGLVELLYYSLSLLAYRGRANVEDLSVLKALVDELSQSQPRLKVA